MVFIIINPILFIYNNLSYSDSFGVAHISKEIKKFIGDKNIITIYRIKAYNSIMCGYFCMDTFLLILC